MDFSGEKSWVKVGLNSEAFGIGLSGVLVGLARFFLRGRLGQRIQLGFLDV